MGETYLDACCFIYLLEGTVEWRSAVETRLRQLTNPAFATSRLSKLECRAKPLRDGNHALLARYDAAFAPDSAHLVDISGGIIDRATELRARYGLKAPDAIHLDTAIDIQASAFWTGDAALARCTEVNVVVLAPTPP